jgi:hypothetical protein
LSGMAPPRRLEASERRRRPRSNGAGKQRWDLALTPVTGGVEREEAPQHPDRGEERAREGVGGECEHAETPQRRDGRGGRAREAAAGGGRGDVEDTTSPEVTPSQRQWSASRTGAWQELECRTSGRPSSGAAA